MDRWRRGVRVVCVLCCGVCVCVLWRVWVGACVGACMRVYVNE